MKKCAFLTMDNLENYECYDQLLIAPMKKLGWSIEEISWRNSSADWNQFDAVIIRSPWDYQQDPNAFLKVLNDIEQSTAKLENNLGLVQWNIEKTYLQDLQNKGIEIVPSLWKDHFMEEELAAFFDEFNTDEIIIKPTISAGADNTFWINRSNKEDYLEKLSLTFSNRSFIVQPFMGFIKKEGEFSVFFFGESYSHTILKTPTSSDFRVQEEHGGFLETVEPEEKLLNTAKKLLQYLEPTPLYTRADYVRTANNSFALMELELIEPSLYFNMDEQSPRRFARVFDQRIEEYTSKT